MKINQNNRINSAITSSKQNKRDEVNCSERNYEGNGLNSIAAYNKASINFKGY